MEQNESIQPNPECLQLLNVNVINEEAPHVQNPINNVSSSLLSISSSKKFKNSSLSLNKKNQNHHSHASNLLSSIKNSTLNVLSKPLTTLSRSPSPQLTLKRNKPIDLETNTNVNKDLNLIETSEDDDDEEIEDYGENNIKNENLSEIEDSNDFNLVKKLKIKNSKILKKNDDFCKAVEEFEEVSEDSDSSLPIENTSNKMKETSKLNTCSTSKPSLKTLSYINSTTQLNTKNTNSSINRDPITNNKNKPFKGKFFFILKINSLRCETELVLESELI
ncbi:unnamed protein product [Brachionus calyciflorus]|uniref:Uncharacterized protein n=1 Tax=Brachionus calyciflorus TaxID=104777 RepID=A0A813NT91_9BILA|nr:unnamed protein product [Brachionus calyciflorus]